MGYLLPAAGGQLWVEVIKNLKAGEQLIAEFCDPTQDKARTSTIDYKPIEAKAEPTTSNAAIAKSGELKEQRFVDMFCIYVSYIVLSVN